MQAPYTKGLSDQALESGDVVQLPAPPRGTLVRLVAKNNTDNTVFNVQLYDRYEAAHSTEEVSLPYEGSPDDNPLLATECHQFAPTMTSTASVLSEYDKVWPYTNKDETDASRRRNHVIYAKVTFAGGGEKGFDFGYTIVGLAYG